jgi:hypothetical protein
MKLRFQTVSDRTECQRYIREASREVDSSTELAIALFDLENGVKQEERTGFGYTDINAPDSEVVRLSNMDARRFEEIVEQLETATATDLGDVDDPQLNTLADYLTEAAEMLRAAKV